MNTAAYTDLLKEMKRELKTSVGCTEPAAVALACAAARSFIDDKLRSIHIRVSKDVFKNGFTVGIPGTPYKGLLIAAAMGFCCGNPDDGLEVLKSADASCLKQAEEIASSGVITVDIDHHRQGVFIHAEIKTEGHTAEVFIEHEHDRITSMILDGTVVHSDPIENQDLKKQGSVFDRVSAKDLYDFAVTADIEDIAFVYNSVHLNLNASQEGLQGTWGLNVGEMLQQLNTSSAEPSDHLLDMPRITKAAALAASASDARMSGCSAAVMINSGSGNQGITATLPVYSIAQDINSDMQNTIRALTISHLYSLYHKHFLDRISAFCGVVTAAVGAGCGVTYLLGGAFEEIEYTIHTALGGISGMICDGAKSSCALKIALAVNNALFASALSLQGRRIPPGEGIVFQHADETIRNIGKVAREGMRTTDDVIVSVMLNGQHRRS